MLTNNVFAYDSAGRDRLTEAALSKGDGRAERARASQQQNGTNYFYLRDHLGSVREMVNGSGSIVSEATYDPYGVATVSGTVTPTFQYAGYYAHQGSGLNLTWYRGYDPVIGRWQARDPLPNAEIKQGLNLYKYVDNEPFKWVDELGRQTGRAGLTKQQTIDILYGGDVNAYNQDINDGNATLKGASDTAKTCILSPIKAPEAVPWIAWWTIKKLIGDIWKKTSPGENWP